MGDSFWLRSPLEGGSRREKSDGCGVCAGFLVCPGVRRQSLAAAAAGKTAKQGAKSPPGSRRKNAGKSAGRRAAWRFRPPAPATCVSRGHRVSAFDRASGGGLSPRPLPERRRDGWSKASPEAGESRRRCGVAVQPLRPRGALAARPGLGDGAVFAEPGTRVGGGAPSRFAGEKPGFAPRRV